MGLGVVYGGCSCCSNGCCTAGTGVVSTWKALFALTGAPALKRLPCAGALVRLAPRPSARPGLVVRVPFSKHRSCVVNGETKRCVHKGKRPDIHQLDKGKRPPDDPVRGRAKSEAAHMRRARAGPERSEEQPVSENNASTPEPTRTHPLRQRLHIRDLNR